MLEKIGLKIGLAPHEELKWKPSSACQVALRRENKTWVNILYS